MRAVVVPESMAISSEIDRSGLDRESTQWLVDLGATTDGPAIERLRELLLRIARKEVQRRNSTGMIRGPELDDIAHQAADDAVVLILSKLTEFRGESRFTTWAYKFVIFEVSRKLGRHFWSEPRADPGDEGWERLPDRFGFGPEEQAESRDLLEAVRWAVEETLTDHQRRVFVSLIVDDVPLDALVIELSTNRNAVYKTMFDSRRKLRKALEAAGYLNDVGSRLP
jgi:RNA polymerase sigma-70 factor (ECF subfamily)